MRRKAVVSFALTALVIVVSGCASAPDGGTSELDKAALAKCLTENGAKMYGAYWCGHCNNQKNEFADAFKYIDYVECDANGPSPDPDACSAAGVGAFPTWVIGGKHYPGEQKLKDLARMSGC